MGRRPGKTTKSGRFMNPADQERKHQRLKELKRNKKQRSAVRTAIIKGRDPDEIIDKLRQLDEQEFDMSLEQPLRTSAGERRNKHRNAYNALINFYRTEGNEEKVKELEKKMQAYELDRFKREQNMKAVKFSETADFGDIPLPSGFNAPNAAMTPATLAQPAYLLPRPPQPAVLKPLLKKRVGLVSVRYSKLQPTRSRKVPPGPPVGFPSDFSDDDDREQPQFDKRESEGRRHVRFQEESSAQQMDDDYYEEEEDLAPVPVPDEIMQHGQFDSGFPTSSQVPTSAFPYRLPPPPPLLRVPGPSAFPECFWPTTQSAVSWLPERAAVPRSGMVYPELRSSPQNMEMLSAGTRGALLVRTPLPETRTLASSYPDSRVHVMPELLQTTTPARMLEPHETRSREKGYAATMPGRELESPAVRLHAEEYARRGYTAQSLEVLRAAMLKKDSLVKYPVLNCPDEQQTNRYGGQLSEIRRMLLLLKDERDEAQAPMTPTSRLHYPEVETIPKPGHYTIPGPRVFTKPCRLLHTAQQSQPLRSTVLSPESESCVVYEVGNQQNITAPNLVQFAGLVYPNYPDSTPCGYTSSVLDFQELLSRASPEASVYGFKSSQGLPPVPGSRRPVLLSLETQRKMLLKGEASKPPPKPPYEVIPQSRKYGLLSPQSQQRMKRLQKQQLAKIKTRVKQRREPPAETKYYAPLPSHVVAPEFLQYLWRMNGGFPDLAAPTPGVQAPKSSPSYHCSQELPKSTANVETNSESSLQPTTPEHSTFLTSYNVSLSLNSHASSSPTPPGFPSLISEIPLPESPAPPPVSTQRPSSCPVTSSSHEPHLPKFTNKSASLSPTQCASKSLECKTESASQSRTADNEQIRKLAHSILKFERKMRLRTKSNPENSTESFPVAAPPLVLPPTFMPNTAVISSAPALINRPKETGGSEGASEAVISAAPQIRDLQKESLQFVPTNLRVQRSGPRQVPSQQKKSTPLTSTKAKSAKSTDEAYAEFLAEIDSLS